MYVSRKRRVTRVLLAMAACCALTGAVVRAQSSYTYTVIADQADLGCFEFHAPAINKKGEVAFGAQCATERIIIRRGDGGTLTPIFTMGTGSSAAHIDVLSINDSGVVAFAVNGPCPNGGGSAIWTGDGGPIEVVHDICATPGFTSVARPSINNAGAVAFTTASGNNPSCSGCYDTVVRVSNGTTITIAGQGSSTSVGTLNAAIEPSINNN